MSDLSPGGGRGSREREVFLDAVQLADAEERRAFLDAACGSDSHLRARVEALLASESTLHRDDCPPECETAPGFGPGPPRVELHTLIDGPDEGGGAAPERGRDAATNDPPAAANEAVVSEGVGDTIGNYRLVGKLGEGGFGVVYLAQQFQPMKRRVALKVIKLGMDTTQVVARFEAERQALAMMDHPGIAKVLDAGATATGRPYFVMELVEGVPITQFCDEQKLNTRERLELFVEVCGAVQHAHQKGIIHRDIKPSNVLVAMPDNQPLAKVIDFGIAKATDVQLTEKTLLTQLEHFIGTPAYMSPEQVQLSGLDIDTRSDVYALGVLLYELLTGCTPFDPEEVLKAGFEEMRRVIREDEPPRPSTRLSTIGDRALLEVARHHQAEPRRLRTVVRGDLDWIVMKALEKDRRRRYETASSFGSDVRRYLNSEAVEASPPSTVYRLRKFARRNRSALAAGSILMLTILAGSALAIWQAIRASNEAENARLASQLAAGEAARARAEQLNAEAARRDAQLRVIAVHMQQAATARDHFHDPLLAGLQYLEAARAAESAGESGWLRSALLAADAIELPLRSFLHDGEIRGALLLADGSRLLTWSTDGTVKLWPLHGGDPLATFTHGAAVKGAEVTADGRRLLTWDDGGKAMVWPLSGGEALATFPHRGLKGVHVLGGRLLTWDDRGTAKLWPLDGGAPLATVQHGEHSLAAQLVPGDGGFLTWSEDGVLRRWSNRGEQLAVFRHDAMVQGAKLLPEGRVLTWSADWTARLWSLDAGGEPLAIYPHRGLVLGAQLMPDGQRVLTWSWDGTASVWPLLGGEPEVTFEHLGLADVLLMADGESLLTMTFDGEIMRWPIGGGKATAQIDFPGLRDIRELPGGRLLLWGTERNAAIWPLGAGAAQATFYHQGEVTGAQILLDGERLLTWSADGSAKIWKIAGEQVRVLKEDAPIREAALIAAGQKLLTWGAGGAVSLWPLSGGDPVTFEHSGIAGAGELGDGENVLTWSKEGSVRCWTSNGEAAGALPDQRPLKSVAPLPGGETLLVFDIYGRAAIWPRAGGKPLIVFEHLNAGEAAEVAKVLKPAKRATAPIFGTESMVTATPEIPGGALVSDDGRRLVTWGFFGTAKLWSTQRAEALATFSHPGINGVLLLQDDQHLLSWSEDGTAMLWPLSGGAPRATFQHDSAIRGAVELPESQAILLWSSDREVKVWPQAGGDALLTLNPSARILGASELPAGGRFLTWGWDGTAKIQEIDKEEPTAVFYHGGWVLGAELLPDEQHVLTWGMDEARLWRRGGGQALARFPHGPNLAPLILDNGRRVLTQSRDGSRIWELKADPTKPVPEQIQHYEYRSGTTLESSGRARALSVEEWTNRR